MAGAAPAAAGDVTAIAVGSGTLLGGLGFEEEIGLMCLLQRDRIGTNGRMGKSRCHLAYVRDDFEDPTYL